MLRLLHLTEYFLLRIILHINLLCPITSRFSQFSRVRTAMIDSGYQFMNILMCFFLVDTACKQMTNITFTINLNMNFKHACMSLCMLVYMLWIIII